MNPEISVIMGTYNSSETLKRSIDSILSQSFSNFEFIICDDCSTDNTLEILKSYERLDDRIKILKNEVNSGLSVSLNNCIQEARSNIIARMDDDDISHKNRFERQIQFMRNHPQYAIVGTSRNLVDDSGVWGTIINDGEPSILDIYKGKSFAHPTVFMDKNILNSVGNYSTDKENRRGQDYDLWCKLYFHGHKGSNLKEVLFDYYESSSSIKRRKLKYRIDTYNKKRYWRKQFKLSKWYMIYEFKDLMIGFIPKSLILKMRKIKFRK